MNIKWSFMVGGCALLITLIIAGAGIPGRAQSDAETIHQVLVTVVDERIPPLTENGLWGYTLPDSANYTPIDDASCPGVVVYLHGERWHGDEIKLWGAMSIQTCPSEHVATEMVESYQPKYLDSIYENIVMVSSTEQMVQGLSSRGIDFVDSLDYDCRDPIIISARECKRKCEVNYPILKKYYDDYSSCYAEWKDFGCEIAECVKLPEDPKIEICTYYHDDERLLNECRSGCWQAEKMGLESCSGTSDMIHTDVWSDGNYLFMAQAPISVGMDLITVLQGCPDCMELSDILKEEADKAGLKATASQQSAPQAPGVPVEFIAQIGIIPNPPAVDQQATFAVDVRGNPPGEGLSYTWYLDNSLLCQSQTCTWRAESGLHSIHVIVQSNATMRQAEHSLGFEVIDTPMKVVDNARAGFTLDYLGCTDNISSDETLACTLGFTRQTEGIGKLTVLWLIDGMTAATESRTDNGSVFSMDEPAPGTHTIEVQVIDSQTGMARVKQAVVDVLEGSNVALPPGAQTGAAIGTLTGLGGWMWSEWFRARQAGKSIPAPKKHTAEKDDTGEVKYEVEKEEETDDDKKKYEVEVDQDKKKDKRFDVDVDEEKGKGNTVKIDEQKDEVRSKEPEKRTAEGQRPGSFTEEKTGGEDVDVANLYNSARVGDFMLGGNLPEGGNQPVRAPATWAPNSKLWEALTKNMSEDQRAKFIRDLKEKYKTTEAALAALRTIRALNAEVQTAEGMDEMVGKAWRFDAGEVAGAHDVLLPDPISVFNESLIRDSAAEARIASLNADIVKNQSAWDQFWFENLTNRAEAEEYSAKLKDAQDNFRGGQDPPTTEEGLKEFQEEYDKLTEQRKRVRALLDDPDFQ